MYPPCLPSDQPSLRLLYSSDNLNSLCVCSKIFQDTGYKVCYPSDIGCCLFLYFNILEEKIVSKSVFWKEYIMQKAPLTDNCVQCLKQWFSKFFMQGASSAAPDIIKGLNIISGDVIVKKSFIDCRHVTGGDWRLQTCSRSWKPETHYMRLLELTTIDRLLMVQILTSSAGTRFKPSMAYLSFYLWERPWGPYNKC